MTCLCNSLVFRLKTLFQTLLIDTCAHLEIMNLMGLSVVFLQEYVLCLGKKGVKGSLMTCGNDFVLTKCFACFFTILKVCWGHII